MNDLVSSDSVTTIGATLNGKCSSAVSTHTHYYVNNKVYIARQRQSKHVNCIPRTTLIFQGKRKASPGWPTTLCSLGEDSTKGQLSWYMGSNLQHKTIHMNALLKTKFSFKNSHCKNENKCLSIRVRE